MEVCCAPGMHGAAFFCFEARQKKKIRVEAGQGQGQNPWGGAGQQLNSGHFRGGAGYEKKDVGSNLVI